MLIHKIQEALSDRILSIVADRTGISAKTLFNLKHGYVKSNASTLKVLADYLKVSSDDE